MSLGLAGLADETYVAEPHLLGNLALHHIFARYTPQPAEDERVMRHDEVAALADGLIHGLFGHVKTQ